MPGALLAFSDMHLHADELDTRESIVYEGTMIFAEFPTVHLRGFEGSVPVPATLALVPQTT